MISKILLYGYPSVLVIPGCSCTFLSVIPCRCESFIIEDRAQEDLFSDVKPDSSWRKGGACCSQGRHNGGTIHHLMFVISMISESGSLHVWPRLAEHFRSKALDANEGWQHIGNSAREMYHTRVWCVEWRVIAFGDQEPYVLRGDIALRHAGSSEALWVHLEWDQTSDGGTPNHPKDG